MNDLQKSLTILVKSLTIFQNRSTILNEIVERFPYGGGYTEPELHGIVESFKESLNPSKIRWVFEGIVESLKDFHEILHSLEEILDDKTPQN